MRGAMEVGEQIRVLVVAAKAAGRAEAIEEAAKLIDAAAVAAAKAKRPVMAAEYEVRAKMIRGL